MPPCVVRVPVRLWRPGVPARAGHLIVARRSARRRIRV